MNETTTPVSQIPAKPLLRFNRRTIAVLTTIVSLLEGTSLTGIAGTGVSMVGPLEAGTRINLWLPIILSAIAGGAKLLNIGINKVLSISETIYD